MFRRVKMDYEKLRKNRNLILSSAKQNKIRTVKVFGSVARREANLGSDLDLLVEFEEDGNLFDLIRFKQSVEALLQVKVDVVTEKSIHRLMKDKILSKAIEV